MPYKDKEKQIEHLRKWQAAASEAAKKAVRGKSIKEYYANPVICLECGGVIKLPDNRKLSEVRIKKFCDRSCAIKFNNKRRPKKTVKSATTLVCGHCGEVVKKKNRQKFCSWKCMRAARYKAWVNLVEEKGLFEGYTYKDTGGRAAKPKRYLLEKQGHCCAICGIREWRYQPFPTVLDHIDGDANNWNINNLRVICRNCDGQLPTYCGKNRNKSTRRLSLIMK